MKRQNNKYNSKGAKRMKPTNKKGALDEDTSRKPVGKGKFPQENETNAPYNDVSWYAKNTQMLNDAASFSYNRPLGGKINLKDVFDPVGANDDLSPASTSIPGLMNMIVAFTPGVSTDYTSPLNLAAQNIYSFVRYKNSGAVNYEPADMMMYLMSMDSAYALWNFGKRAYGVIRSYSQKNWYMPQMLIESMGLDFMDFKRNLSDLRLYLNTMAARLESFCVPAVMPLFIRHSWMFSNVWADSSDAKAQLYMFNPYYFYQYSEVTVGGGSLQPVEWCKWTKNSTVYANQFNPTLKSFSEFVDYCDTLINSLSQSEDIGIMSGDILKAYESGNLFKVTAIEPDYTVSPVYNEEVLNQIHNATVLFETYRTPTNTWAITQDVNSQTLLFNPEMATEPYNVNGLVINMPWENVTPANTMVGTRLSCCTKSVITVDPTPTTHTEFSAVGTEAVVFSFIGFRNYVPNSGLPFETEWYGLKTVERVFHVIQSTLMKDSYTKAEVVDLINSAVDDMGNEAIANITIRCLASQFDWHPIMYQYTRWDHYNADGSIAVGANNIGALQGDMNNYTIITSEDLKQMHLTAIMSEFNIPQLGSF